MAELDFERRLERLFQEAPEAPDAAGFAERVERRLDRGWTARRWLIGAAGITGGLIGVSQLVLSDVFQRMGSVEASARLISSHLSQTSPAQWISAASGDAVVIWVAAGVALAMTGFVLTRVIEEI